MSLIKSTLMVIILFSMVGCSKSPKPMMTDSKKEYLRELKTNFETKIPKYFQKSNYRKIQLINYQLQTYPYIKDIDNYNEYEHFATKEEFFTKMGGDCEDTAYIKYLYAMDMKMSSDDFRFLVGEYLGNGHVVLQYHDKETDKKYIMEREEIFKKESYLNYYFKEYQTMTIKEYLNHREELDTWNILYKYGYIFIHELRLYPNNLKKTTD